MNIEQIFKSWSNKIENLEKLTETWNTADVNYHSVFAHAIKRVVASNSVTLAKDIAKGEKDVLDALTARYEAERAVKACNAQIEWLRDRHNWEKKKVGLEDNICTS